MSCLSLLSMKSAASVMVLSQVCHMMCSYNIITGQTFTDRVAGSGRFDTSAEVGMRA